MAANWHWYELMITAAHYAVVHCPPQRTIGAAEQPADMPLSQSATLDVNPVARKLLLIFHPTEGKRQS